MGWECGCRVWGYVIWFSCVLVCVGRDVGCEYLVAERRWTMCIEGVFSSKTTFGAICNVPGDGV